ncbi:fluoride efflux transporter CrcB [Flavobacterium sp. H122]|uniref:fluoride efflux transporter CrcB n=1 Tax=Flavobacterium sp. H122 TaxID=2529860 RepID=UPI0010AB106D|nr:fluoride efflux transporter CrcB [Flavobacterium sp. H122]
MKTIFYIALGGGLGSVLRYLTSLFFTKFQLGNFPLGTFVANVVGCFLIGVFFGYFEKQTGSSQDLKFFLITGICGGYTTFSAFSNENIQLIQNNQIGTAFLYTALSIVLGFGMTYLGLQIIKSFF